MPTATQSFTFTCPTLNATTYTIQATGIGSMAGFIYTIDQANAQATPAAPRGLGGCPAAIIGS